MVNTRRNGDGDVPDFEAMINAALANALPNLSTGLRTQILDEIRNGAGTSGGNGGGGGPSTTIAGWIKEFNKLKPLAFKSAATSAEAEDWITHMEKLFQVLGCPDNFKTRLAAFKLEGDALSWWTAHLKTQAAGEAFAETCTWATFRDIFYNRYFPVSEQQRFEREYGSIYQQEKENSVEYMQRFMRLVSFVGPAAGDAVRQARHYKWGLKRILLDKMVNLDYADVAQVCAAARNIELLDENGSSNKRGRNGDRIQSRESGQRTSDRQRDDRRGYNYDNQRSWRDRNMAQGTYHDTRSKDQEQKQNQDRIAQCATCGKYHRGICNRITNACFSCGSTDHKIKDCPKYQANDYNKKAREDKQSQPGGRARD